MSEMGYRLQFRLVFFVYKHLLDTLAKHLNVTSALGRERCCDSKHAGCSDVTKIVSCQPGVEPSAFNRLALDSAPASHKFCCQWQSE